MLYFSELKNKKVVTENGVNVGKLTDLIFEASDNPLITKLVILSVHRIPQNIPIQFLKKINKVIVLTGQYEFSTLEDNELYAQKNLLDKQIIDIKGNKIVRVNDIVIQNKQGPLAISGVDIGWLGILRWLKLEPLAISLSKLFPLTSQTSSFLSWSDIQPLELVRGKVQLKKEDKKLQKIKPEDLADYLERTTIANASKFLKILDESQAAEVINSLNINYQTGLFRLFSIEQAAKILSLIDPDEAVDILLTFTVKKRDQVIELLHPDKKKEIIYLLGLSKTPMGDLISPEFLTVTPETTVDVAVKLIKEKTSGFSFLDYIYVINKENQLVGVFNLQELLLEDNQTAVYKFMIQDVEVIHLTTPVEIAVKKMIKYKIHALPVIDKDKRLLGIIPFDNITGFLASKL